MQVDSGLVMLSLVIRRNAEMKYDGRSCQCIARPDGELVGTLEVQLCQVVESSCHEKRDKQDNAAHELEVLPGPKGVFQTSKYIAAFLLQCFIVGGVPLDIRDGVSDQAFACYMFCQVCAGIVGDGLVQGIAVRAAVFEQADIAQGIERLWRCLRDG